jgi:choline kinase
MKYENTRPPIAVILAADTGSRLSPLTDNCPCGLLSVGGSAVLERMIRNCLSCGISQFVLVLGHRADDIKQYVSKAFKGIRVTYVINERYLTTNSGYSLALAASAIGTSEFIKFDANVVFDTQILRRLVDDERPNVLCIDRSVPLTDETVKVVTDAQMRVTEIGKTVDPKIALGNAIGIEKISAVTGPVLFAELTKMMESASRAQGGIEIAYAWLIGKGIPFQALDITELSWTEIDTAEDFSAANAMFKTPSTMISRGQQKALDEDAERKLHTL